MDDIIREPRNEDLDPVFERAVRIVSPPPLPGVKRKRQPRPRLVLDDPGQIRALREALTITAPAHGIYLDIMSPSSPVLALFDEEGKQITTIGIVDGDYLRWPERWDADPPLLSPRKLQAWLIEVGLPTS